MRAAGLLLVGSVLALAACGPSGGASGSASATNASAAGGGFPTGRAASYRQEATLTIGGQATPEVIYRDGGKMRTELNGPMGHLVSVTNNETHEGFTLATVMGRTIAQRMDLSQQSTQQASPADIDQLRAQMQGRAHQIGTCTAAGESGSEWEMNPPDGGGDAAQQRSICLTSDGILLQMKMNNEVVFNTTAVQRGPQDPTLFTPPAGVQFTTVHAPSQSEINEMVARAKAAAATHGAP